MKLSLNQEAARPFPCPDCREYLAMGVTECRFCGAKILQAVAQAAVRTEALRNRLYRKKHYAKHLRLGAGLFALGLIIMIASYFFFQKVLDTEFVWISRGLIFGGGLDSLYGITGLVSEARSAKREGL